MSAHDGAASTLFDLPLSLLLDELADRLADRIACKEGSSQEPDRWLSTEEAAKHLGMHPDTLRRLAGERRIPFQQDGPNCKMHFRLSTVDEWRAAGGSTARSTAGEASKRLPYPLKVA